MGQRLYHESLSGRQAIEEDLEAHGYQKATDTSHHYDRPSLIFAGAKELPAGITEAQANEARERFDHAATSYEKLQALSALSLREAVTLLDKTISDPVLRENLEDCLSKYDAQIRRREEGTEYDSELENSLLRDLYAIAMDGSPESIIMSRVAATQRNTEYSDGLFPTVQGDESKIYWKIKGLGQWETLHDLFVKSFNSPHVSRIADPVKKQNEAVDQVVQWSMNRAEYLSNFGDDYWYLSNEESWGIAMLGRNIRERLVEIRYKQHPEAVSFENIGRFSTYSEDDSLYEKRSRLEEDIAIVTSPESYYREQREKITLRNRGKDRYELRPLLDQEHNRITDRWFQLKNTGETVDRLEKELEDLKKRSQGRNLADQAIDLHIRFNEAPAGELARYAGGIDWLNKASFGTIRRASRAFERGVSEKNVFLLALGEMIPGLENFGRREYLILEETLFGKREQKKEKRGWDDRGDDDEYYDNDDDNRFENFNDGGENQNTNTVLNLLSVGDFLDAHSEKATFSQMCALARLDRKEVTTMMEYQDVKTILHWADQGVDLSHACEVVKFLTHFQKPISLKEIQSIPQGALNDWWLVREVYNFEQMMFFVTHNASLRNVDRAKYFLEQRGLGDDTISVVAFSRGLQRDYEDTVERGVAEVGVEMMRELYESENGSYDLFCNLRNILNNCDAVFTVPELIELTKASTDNYDLSYLIDATYTFDEIMQMVRKGMALDYIREAWSQYYDSYLQGSLTPEKIEAIRREKDVEMPKNFIADLITNALTGDDDNAFALAEYFWQPDRPVEELLTSLRAGNLSQPRSFVLLVDRLKASAKERSRPFATACREALEKDPWIVMLQRLRSVQRLAKKEDHCPWVLELTPLMEKLFETGELDANNPKDAERIFSFVRDFGMVNLPRLFAISSECEQADNLESLRPATVQALEEFGIRLRRPDGKPRFSPPKLIVNEVRRMSRELQDDILTDNIPKNLVTEIGLELLNRFKRTSNWERGHDEKSLCLQWMETIAANPEKAKLPAGYEEAAIKVIAKKRDKEESSEETVSRDAVLQEVFGSQEINDTYMPLARAISHGLRVKDISVWWQVLQREQKELLENDRIELLQMLASPEAVAEAAAAATDPEQKKMWNKRVAMLNNPKAKKGLEQKVKGLEQDITRLEAMTISGRHQDLVPLMHELRLMKHIDVKHVLRSVSAVQILRSLPEQWYADLQRAFGTRVDPSLERLEFVAELSRNYIAEHYLNRNPQHARHQVFSEPLRRDLVAVWQQQGEKFPIEVVLENIRKKIGESTAEDEKSLTLSMVPAGGIPRIFSGDIGDACFTSQHDLLAQGEFPRLHTWTFVTNRHKSTELPQGSLLGITAQTVDGRPALIARANNPRENLIQTVDPGSFCKESLLQVVATARRMREERLPASTDPLDKKQIVMVPLEGQTNMAATNRPGIWREYARRFSECHKAGLVGEQDLKFNGYDLSNPRGYSPCVVIWEMGEDGQEKWYGDWK